VCPDNSTGPWGHFGVRDKGKHVRELQASAAERAGVATTWRDELVARATSIATGAPRRPAELALPRALARRIDRSEARARSLSAATAFGPEGSRLATLDFLAEAATALVHDEATEAGEVRLTVAETARAIGIPEDAAALAVFVRALGSTDAAALPPQAAIGLFADLLVELGPARAVSLWSADPSGRSRCLAGAGDAPTSRRLRDAARSALVHGVVSTPHVRAVAVERWDRPFAAVAARCRIDDSEALGVYLAELAAALSPVLEREMLFDQSEARERTLVAGVERRLLRLALDLHDGPLQDIVVLTEDIRLARDQVTTLIDGKMGRLVRGRFEDLDSRLAALDRGLRGIARSARSTSVLEQPLESALRTEVDALSRATAIETEFTVDGDVSTLTASQKIALFRVVQESLSNVRKHSGATKARVRLRSAPRFVTLVITDNGHGFEGGTMRNDRLGLLGVAERVRLLGGDVEIDGRPGAGARVRATLPRWLPVAGAGKETASVYSVIA
jgi:signal transduction histidine kinase